MSLTIELRGVTWSAGRPRPAELFASFVVDGRDARRSIFNFGTDGARSHPSSLGFGWLWGRCFVFTVLLDPLVALRAQFKEGPRIFVQALAL
jgi:hypothetical protein